MRFKVEVLLALLFGGLALLGLIVPTLGYVFLFVAFLLAVDIVASLRGYQLRWRMPIYRKMLRKPTIDPIGDSQIIPIAVDYPEAKGFLDFQLEGEKAVKEMTKLFNRISKDTLAIGNKITSHTQHIERKKAKGRLDTTQSQKIASQSAKDMDWYSTRLEIILPSVEETSVLLSDSWRGYVTWLTPKTEGKKAQLLTYRENIAPFLDMTKSALSSVHSFRDSADGLRELSVSQNINRASRRLEKALDSLEVILNSTVKSCTEILSLIDEKLVSS